MTKYEFSKELRRALSGRVSHTVVNENVAYYERYIDTEIKKGRSEKEVLEELGDPRLLAKTIIATAGAEADAYVEEAEKQSSEKTTSGRIFRLPLWVGIIVVLLIVVLVFKVVGVVLGLLLPIAIPVAIIYFLVSYFRRR